MNKREFDFYLIHSGDPDNRVAVNPYYQKLEKKTAKESGQEFYRTSLEGNIFFVGDDFDLIYNSSISDTFTLVIMQYRNGYPVEYYRGTFTKANCKLDVAKKTAEPKLKTDDAYQKILDMYKDEFNLVDLHIPSEPIVCTKRPFLQIYCMGSSSITNIHNGRSWETGTSAALESGANMTDRGFSNVAFFREIYVEGADLEAVNGIYSEYVYSQSSDGMLSAHRWYKKVNNIRTYYIELVRSYNSGPYAARICQAGTDTILYYTSNPADIPGSMFDQKGSLVGLTFTNGSSNIFVIHKDFQYNLYGRIIHNDSSQGTALGSEDFAMSNLSYKYKSPMPEDFTFQASSDSTLDETPYGRNDYNEYFTPQWLPALLDTDKYVPVCRSSWANMSMWFAYEKTEIDSIDDTYSQTYTLRDSFNIGKVIKALLEKMGTNVAHDSTADYSRFLYDPTFMLPNMAAPLHVNITQKTNMIKGIYDQAAQMAKVSLETILNMLRDCFRCYWYIDNGNFRLEHISYFLKGMSYSSSISIARDFTGYKDQFNNKPLMAGQAQLEYDLSDLNRKYNFDYADESYLPFSGVILETNAPYIEGDKTEDISLGEFSADVDFMQFSPDSVTQDGFALLCPRYIDGFLTLPIEEVSIVESGKPFSIRVQNIEASWAKLLDYYSWDVPSNDMTSNVTVPYTVHGLKECLSHTVKVPYDMALRPYMAVLTQFGPARIISVIENLDTGILTIELVYPLS